MDQKDLEERGKPSKPFSILLLSFTFVFVLGMLIALLAASHGHFSLRNPEQLFVSLLSLSSIVGAISFSFFVSDRFKIIDKNIFLMFLRVLYPLLLACVVFLTYLDIKLLTVEESVIISPVEFVILLAAILIMTYTNYCLFFMYKFEKK
jgi:hypothetical protein